MEFEFDEAKSQASLAKHGIDFVAAQRIWRDEARVTVAGCTRGEPRWIVTGRVDGVLFAAVMTWRGARVRIISVRRAHGIEVRLYEDRER